MICQIKGCKRKVKVIKHKLCEAHLRRWERTGKPGNGKIRKYIKKEPFVLNNINQG
jgi:hypothetical protein